jgi:hypothetical protein
LFFVVNQKGCLDRGSRKPSRAHPGAEPEEGIIADPCGNGFAGSRLVTLGQAVLRSFDLWKLVNRVATGRVGIDDPAQSRWVVLAI